MPTSSKNNLPVKSKSRIVASLAASTIVLLIIVFLLLHKLNHAVFLKEEAFNNDAKILASKIREQVKQTKDYMDRWPEILKLTSEFAFYRKNEQPIPREIMRQLLDFHPYIEKYAVVERVVEDDLKAWEEKLRESAPSISKRSMIARKLTAKNVYKKLDKQPYYYLIREIYPLQDSAELLGLNVISHEYLSEGIKVANETGNVSATATQLLNKDTLENSSYVTLYKAIYPKSYDEKSGENIKSTEKIEPNSFIMASISLEKLIEGVSELYNKPINVTLIKLSNNDSELDTTSISYRFPTQENKSDEATPKMKEQKLYQEILRIGDDFYRLSFTPAAVYN